MLQDPRETVTANVEHGEKRFLILNRDRLRRVQDSLTPRQRDFLEILPLLFHINHPLLPGYVSKDTPAGINDYGPTEHTLRAVKRICRSFDYERRTAVRFPIRGLYMMGSPGTIAYTRHSDLDMWLCHDPELPQPAVDLLAEKARRIETFAAEIGLEVHFFVLDPDRFRAGETLAMSDESSGSSQHSLLLDEFYRSSLLVAGLRPLWWRVPSRHEADYESYVREAVAARQLDPRDYIDFGGLHSIPVEEFFGAAVWQLYKSIKSPYKSVLKLLLMEAYAAEFPNITLLSQRYKRNIESEHVNLDSLDPYILMYTKVEEHLTARNDPVRLDVLRRSFYIKANLRLSTRGPLAAEDWRADVLNHMVQAWGWHWDQVARLDQREAWRIDTAVEERRDLINTLKDSYAMLSQFARAQANDHKISGQDLHVLGRQLYAAFEKKPAKIEVVTRGICSNPQEASLSLHELKLADNSVVWMLFTGMVRPAEVQFRRPLKRCASAAEILVWCHLNRLSDPTTSWHVFTQTNELSALEIKRTTEALATSLVEDDGDEEDGVRAKPRVARVTLLVNVGVSTFSNAVSGGGVLTSTRTDAFQFGARRMNLVRTVDLIFGTTWGETYSYHYEGNNAVLEALAECLQWSDAQAGDLAVPPIVAHCFTSDYANQIAERVATTFTTAYGFLLAHARSATPHFVIEIDDQLHHIRMQDGKPHIDVHGGQTVLLRVLGDTNAARFNTVHFDGECAHAGVLPHIYPHNRPGRLQIFARQRGQFADIYIIDERGLLLVHRQECYNMPALLHHYRRFLDTALPRCGYDGIGEDDPQRLLPVDTIELMTAGGAVHLKSHADPHMPVAPYLSIQVLADADTHGHQQFTINANHREFSTWEHGGSLFVQVAEFVLSQRRQGEIYPIYITDLDLSPRFRKQIGIETLRPLDLLNYKKRIEFQLTRALLRDVAGAGGGSIALAS